MKLLYNCHAKRYLPRVDEIHGGKAKTIEGMIRIGIFPCGKILLFFYNVRFCNAGR